MKHKYIVVQNTYKNGNATRISFGIAAIEEYDGVTTILESISDLSSNLKSIERLVDICNNLQLDLIHLRDVVNDFLATV